MASEIKASISVSLGKDATSGSSSVSAEIDTRSIEEGGLNASRLGKTDGFEPGDEIAVLLYLSEGVVYDPNTYPNECYVKFSLENESSASFRYANQTAIIDVSEQLKFDGSSRTANLKRPCQSVLTFEQWIGNNLASYYEGIPSLDTNKVTLNLAPIPTSWVPAYVATDSAETRLSKMNAFAKRTRAVGIVDVNYKTLAHIFKLNTPSYTVMKKYGKPPYPVDIVIYCKQLES